MGGGLKAHGRTGMAWKVRAAKLKLKLKLGLLHGPGILPAISRSSPPWIPSPQYNVNLFNALSVACQAQLHRFNTQVCAGAAVQVWGVWSQVWGSCGTDGAVCPFFECVRVGAVGVVCGGITYPGIHVGGVITVGGYEKSVQRPSNMLCLFIFGLSFGGTNHQIHCPLNQLPSFPSSLPPFLPAFNIHRTWPTRPGPLASPATATALYLSQLSAPCRACCPA